MAKIYIALLIEIHPTPYLEEDILVKIMNKEMLIVNIT